jgi:hypothetical protein
VVVRGREVSDRIVTELWNWGRKDELVQAEGGSRTVDFHEETEACEGCGPAQSAPGFRVLAAERPGIALRLFQFAPPWGDVAEIGANAHLSRGLGVVRDQVLPLNLAVPGF